MTITMANAEAAVRSGNDQTSYAMLCARASAALSLCGLLLFNTGCATHTSDAGMLSDAAQEQNALKSMVIDNTMDVRDVMVAVPPKAILERFDMVDGSGHRFAYLALTQGEPAGVVFVDGRLYGTVPRRDVVSFYSCRGYASALHNHWAGSAPAWFASLQQASVPTQRVDLQFSDKDHVQSIVDVVNDPSLNEVNSLLDLGTNPLGIFRKLSSARSNYMEQEKFKSILQQLRALSPGASEASVAQITKPEDVSFAAGGLVMAYPRFSVEFFVNAGSVQLIQQPSFYQLAHTQAARFYKPNAKWELCTPQQWRTALPQE